MRVVVYLFAPHLPADIRQAAEPSLQGRPLALVEGARIVDVSQEAERAGLWPAMPLHQARLACPALVVRPYRASESQGYLRRLWQALVAGSAAVEPDGLRGVFVEPVEAGRSGDELEQVGWQLLDRARTALRAGWAVGVGPNKLVAKAAALLQAQAGRMGGVRAVAPQEAASFMGSLPLRFLWPLPGRVLEDLARLGFHTAGEVARLGSEALIGRFGRLGWQLWRMARGIDGDPVLPVYPPPALEKSLDLETWGPGALEQGAALEQAVRRWAGELQEDLQKAGQRAGRLGLQLHLAAARRPDPAAGPADSRPVRVGHAVYLSGVRQGRQAMADIAARLLHRVLSKATPWLKSGALPVRLILSAVDLESASRRQLPMLESRPARQRAQLQLAVEAVRRQVGPGHIQTASRLPLPRRDAMRALIEKGEGLP